ncbi:MAG: YhjD/YihY/BrkB family envelope integrity protein [Acidimicrobiales bacterium]
MRTTITSRSGNLRPAGRRGCQSLCLDGLGHASRTYGNLAGVAVLLIWLFLTGVVVLLGAELDRKLERFAEHSAVAASHSAWPGTTTGRRL